MSKVVNVGGLGELLSCGHVNLYRNGERPAPAKKRRCLICEWKRDRAKRREQSEDRKTI